MKKKLLSILLVLLMLVTMIPAAALAVEGEGEPAPEGSGEPAPIAEDPKYTVKFNVTNANDGPLAQASVMISKGEGETVGSTIAYVSTNTSGIATYSLPNGVYYAHVSYTSGRNSYYDDTFFTVNGENIEVQLEAKNGYTNQYESTYNRTEYFNHVDVRVKGTMTSGSTIDINSYGITLRNVRVVVNNEGYQDYDFSFTNSTDYEWRKDNIRVYKNAVVTITCDIYVDGVKTVAGYSQSFFGKNDFIQAIENCDMKWGLDFIVNPVDIIQAALLDVTYSWTMADGSAVPAAIPAPPTGDLDKKPGDIHTINTHYPAGSYVIDEANGKIYTFSGWTHWSDEDAPKTAIPSGTTQLEIDSNTVIYGTWSEGSLETAEHHITITKKFDGVTPPADWHIKLVGPAGGTMEIPLKQFTLSNGVYTYNLPVYSTGTYTITEHDYDVTGYTATASSAIIGATNEATHDHIAAASTANGSTVTLVINKLDYEFASATPCDNIGTVSFINTYKKELGEDVHSYPSLRINKMDADTRAILAGATFEIRQNGAVAKNINGDSLVSTTDASGYAYFYYIPAGEYEIVETKAPDGYMEGYALYKLTVTKNVTPEEQLIDGKWCKVYSYEMDISVSTDGGISEHPSEHFSLGTTGTRYRLGAFNEKIGGELTISKDIAGDFDENTYHDDIVVHVSGPNGYERVLTLNADTDEDKLTDTIWSITLTGLELGKYTVTERNASIPGYEINTTINGNDVTEVKITLDKSDVPTGYDQSDPVAKETVAIVNTYAKIIGADVKLLPDLHLQKYITGKKTALEGAEFTLTQITDEDGNVPTNPVVITRKTSDLGRITFATLQPGTYKLVEEAAPDGYTKDDTVYTVVVSEDETKREEKLKDDNSRFYYIKTYDVTVTKDNTTADEFDANTNTIIVENQKAYGTLTIEKDYGVNSAPADIVGIEFQVTGVDGETVVYNERHTLKAEDNGIIVIDKLPFGTYTVEEIYESAVRKGYDLTVADNGKKENIIISATSDEHKITIVNTYSEIKIHPASFTVKKVDAETEEPLEGVVFVLKDSTGKVVSEKETDFNGEVVFAGFTSAATYTLEEQSTLDNYVKSTSSWNITVSLNNGKPTVKVNEKKNFFESIYDWIAGSSESNWNGGVLTVENTKKTTNLVVSKDVEYYLDGDEVLYDELPAEFKAMVAGEYYFEVTIDDTKETIKLEAGDEKKYTLAYGTTYSVVEKFTDSDVFNVTTTDNAKGTIGDDTTLVEFNNRYNFWTYEETRDDEHTVFDYDWVTVDVYKADSETKEMLKGAEYTLYSDKECKTEVAKVVSDDTGKMTFVIKTAGTFYIKETKAPAGYDIDPTAYPVTTEVTYTTEKSGGEKHIVEHVKATAGIDKVEGTHYVVQDDPLYPEISVEKKQATTKGATSGKLKVYAGDVITYTITVKNSGDVASKGLQVADEIPEGLVYVKDSVTEGGIVKDGIVYWDIDKVDAGKEIVLSFKVTVPEVETGKWANVVQFIYDNNAEGETEIEKSNEVVAEYVNTPNTGDVSSFALFAALAALAAAGFVTVLVKSRKKHD